MALTKEYLKSLPKEERLIKMLKETEKCQKDAMYTITNYFTLIDPVLSKRVPAKLYTYQNAAIIAFEEWDYNLTMKTRQTGMTTITELYVAWFMIAKENQVINILAQEKKASRKFLRNVRKVLDDARMRAPWLIPWYLDGQNGREAYALTNNSSIMAEANKPDACRGDVINLLVIDEVAAISWMNDIWASAGLTLTRSQGKCIAISTPKGMSGWYYEQYTNAEANGWNIIDAHWSEHPMYKEGMYQFIKQADHPEGGFVKFFNETWPDLTRKENARRYAPKNIYSFVLDGRIRSPWYDIESKKLGVQKTRCELDCSFSGSGGEVIDPERIRDLEIIAKTKKPINLPRGGLWKSYKVFFDPVKDHIDLEHMENSVVAHRYIIVCDTATGDGSDFSAFCVIDLDTMEVVATFKEQLDPKNYAHIIAEVATAYNKGLVIIEYQEGLTTLLELRDVVKYKNVFYSTLKKQDVTKVQKRKIGFWQSESTRTLGGDKLEEVLNTGELKIYSMDVLAELYTWVWDKKGRRTHASEKHDDLLMSLTIGMFFIHYVLTRRELNKEFFKKHVGRTVQSAMVGTSNRLTQKGYSDIDEEMFDPEFRTQTRQ